MVVEVSDEPKVKAYDRQGNKIEVPKSEVGRLYALGGRVAKREEVDAHALNEQYEKSTTAQKVVGHLSAAAGPIASNALAATGAATLRPEVEAFQSGEASAATLGFDKVATKEALEQVSGKQAGQAYAQHIQNVEKTQGGYSTAGQLAGMAAMAAMPMGGPIGAIGGVAERGAAQALSGLAARGALGRAVATGGEFAARGAVEGALYGAGHQVSEDLLGDHDLAADKIFSAAGLGALYGGAGGAALGASGSLVASGARGVAGLAKSGLSRAMSRGEQAAVEAESKIATTAAEAGAAKLEQTTERLAEAAEGTLAAARSAPKTTGLPGLVNDPSAAARRLSNDLAVDALGATKVQAREALEHIAPTLAEAREAAGEYVNRIAIKPATAESGVLGGALKAGASGRADQLLDAITADKYGRVAEGLSKSVKTTAASFEVGELNAAARKIYNEMLRDPTKIAGAEAFKGRVQLETQALINAGKIANGVADAEGRLVSGTMDASEAFYARAAMEKNAYELARSSSAAGDAYKQLMREWDGAIVRTIDDAAAKAGKSGVADEIRHWKREWQLASAAEKLATYGTERVKSNNIFGIREGIGAAVGLATGHPVGAIAGAVGGKMMRERGAAAGAFLLGRIADSDALTAVIRRFDDQVGRSAKGLLAPPPKRALPESMPGNPQAQARAAMKEVAAWQADPEGTIDKIVRSTEGISASSPNVANALVQRTVDALSFLASKKPSGGDPDPFDPHPAPRMTDQQAHEFASYMWYAQKPERFFVEVEHGKLTYEGAETARALMPRAFAELQARTAEALATQLASGKAPAFQQQLKIDSVLDMNTLPSRRPEHMLLLQQNVAPLPSQGGGGPSRRSAQIKPQRSALDRLEADGIGRR